MDYCPSEEDEDADAPILTKEQEEQVASLRQEIEEARHAAFRAPREPATVESLFEGCPDGNISFEGDPEDVGNAWNCGEEDCESGGWHQSVQCIEQGREDGKTWFIVTEDSNSGDGDYQPVAGWDEREGDEITDEILADLWHHLQGRSVDHFAGWGTYCLDVAVTGKDPLNNWCYGKTPTVEDAINAARENLKYLKM
jgi:hypothetical protein